jgi:serine/threonine protein kinase/tetratricopeptide (TPR) repeat protein
MSSRVDDPNRADAHLADDEPDNDDDFLRELAHVEDVAPPTRQPAAGQMLGRFRILSELGRGGMGIVYLAHDENLRRAVALKLLPPSLTRQEERTRRFLREARAAAAVTHPNLATIYDVGEVEGNIFIAMERVDGRTLRKLLASGRPPIEEAVHVASQILAGLAKAHQAGIVHRDLKPDNIMVTDDGVIKLLDFGLAKQHDGVSGQLAGSGSVERAERGDPGEKHDTLPRDTGADQLLGTPGYMSPEQIRGGPIDPRSDLFSFGVIFYEMLAGKRPFAGQSAADLQSAILRDTPPSLSDLRDDLPEGLVRLVERCLEKDSARRYPSSGALSIALAQLDLSTPRLLTPSSSTLGDAASSSPSRAMTTVKRFGDRAGSVAKVLAAVLVALLAGLFFRRTSDTEAAKGGAAAGAMAAVAAQAAATPVTDLPLPQSKSADAVAEYATALQGIRDGNWGYASSHLARAIELDSSFAMAHLRMAIIHGDSPFMRPRSHYALAVAGRGRLSEREQVMLNAYEPLLSRDPPDMAEHIARLRAAVARFPGDAEFPAMLAWTQREDPEEKLAYARRAVELDPQFADGWQMVGASLFMLGKTDEALRALDRCVAISPATADCSGERGFLHGSEGRCAEMEENFRRAVAGSTNGMWQEGRAAALFALGAAPEAIAEVLRNRWPQPQVAERERAGLELIDRSNLGAAIGDFAEAEKLALAARNLVASEPEARTHALLAAQLVELYTETNRPKDAGKIADDYLKRKDVWIRSPMSDRQPISMYWAMLRAKTLTRESFVQKRDAWLRERRNDSRQANVLASYACGAETPEEAREALALFPDVPPPRVLMEKDFVLPMFGKLYALAGMAEEAVPYLERTVKSCYALLSPFIHTRSSYYLGQALEATGDTAGACSAYATVLARWGNAKPESVTAGKARERSRQLRCASAGNSADTATPRAG